MAQTLGPLRAQPAATSARLSDAGNGPGSAGLGSHPSGEAVEGVGSSGVAAGATSASALSPEARRAGAATASAPAGGSGGGASAVTAAATLTKSPAGVGATAPGRSGAGAPAAPVPEARPGSAIVARFVPGGALGGVGAAAWTQGKLLERIAPFLAGEPPTRASVFSGLASLDHETLGGLVPPIAFPDGDRTKVNLCIVPLRFGGGRFQPLGGDDGTFECAPGWAPAQRN